MTSFSVSLNDPANVADGQADNIVRSMQTAANLWANNIQGYGNIEIEVDFAQQSGSIATGGPAITTFAGTSNGAVLYDPGAVSEIRDGVDPNGSDPDLRVTINSDWVQQLSYDPSFSQAVPFDKVDAVSVFEHEIGHGLGIISFLDSDGSLPNDGTGPYEMSSDRYVETNNGSPQFAGPNSEAAHGGPVPLADDGYFSHIALDGDVMEAASSYGERRFISDVDLGRLQDAGLPIGTGRADSIGLSDADNVFRAYDGNDMVEGNGGADIIYGNQGADTLFGNLGSDRLFGGQGDDAAFGGQDDDVVYGNLGNDAIYGNLGNDVLFGGQGDDLLYGGQGNDTLYGNLGNDTMAGGLGADIYVSNGNSGNDLIVGFDQSAGDRINLQGQSDSVSTAQDGSALLNLSGGGTLELLGIAANQVNPGFFTAGTTA